MLPGRVCAVVITAVAVVATVAVYLALVLVVPSRLARTILAIFVVVLRASNHTYLPPSDIRYKQNGG